MNTNEIVNNLKRQMLEIQEQRKSPDLKKKEKDAKLRVYLKTELEHVRSLFEEICKGIDSTLYVELKLKSFDYGKWENVTVHGLDYILGKTYALIAKSSYNESNVKTTFYVTPCSYCKGGVQWDINLEEELNHVVIKENGLFTPGTCFNRLLQNPIYFNLLSEGLMELSEKKWETFKLKPLEIKAREALVNEEIKTSTGLLTVRKSDIIVWKNSDVFLYEKDVFEKEYEKVK